MARAGFLVGLALLAAFSAQATFAASECVSQRSLEEVREQLSDEVQETSQQLVQMAIILERIESKLDKLESRSAAPSPSVQAVAPANDVFDNRLRSLETSVSGLQKQMDTKLDQSLDRVVTVERNRQDQEKIFTDILKKILNTVNTVYERMVSGVSGSPRSSGNSGLHTRPPQNQQQLVFLQDHMESQGREIKEKMGILQERVIDSTSEVAMMSRMMLEKMAYLIENMPSQGDLERIGERQPQIIENDISKVIEEVRDGFKRCTRAVVNAPPMVQAISQGGTSSNSIPVHPRSQLAPEMSFFLGSKQENCKMTSSVRVPHNCDQLAQGGANCDGPYIVYDSFGKKPMKVMCDMSDGGWTLILRRGPAQGAQPLSFDRSWSSYKHGFGSIHDEFYFGNENIHKLTESAKLLRIELEAFDGEKLILDYGNFTVAGESDNYRLRVGRYLGNHTRVGNAFRRHNDQLFSTSDKVNGHRHCPVGHKAGYWWHSCYSVLLTGEYATPTMSNAKNGIRWSTWKQEPLKAVVMKVRQMPS